MQKPCRDWLEAEGKEAAATKVREKWHYEKVKVVKFTLKPDRKKTGDGSHLLPVKRTAKSGRGICTFLPEIQSETSEIVI